MFNLLCEERRLNFVMERDGKESAISFAKQMIKQYRSDNTWYNCPMSEEGCANPEDGDGCNCGATKHNEAVTALYDSILKEVSAKGDSNEKY